jgi:hypothetical protein
MKREKESPSSPCVPSLLSVKRMLTGEDKGREGLQMLGGEEKEKRAREKPFTSMWRAPLSWLLVGDVGIARCCRRCGY